MRERIRLTLILWLWFAALVCAQVVTTKPIEYSASTAAQIQTLIDRMAAGTLTPGAINLEPRTYTVSSPIIVAKLSGGSYSTITGITIQTRGNPNSYFEDVPSQCARLVASYTDGPVIAIQGGRGIVLRGLKVVGASNYASLAGSAYLTAGTGNNYGDLVGVESNFTATAAARTNQYSPSCCIAIDPFGSTSQVATGNRYPSVSSSYYVGNTGSSRIAIENCVLQHSQVGILVGAGVTSNSSECTVENVLIHGCKYGISLCHTQAKNWHVRGLSFSAVWGVVTGKQHGAQVGPLPCIWGLDGSQANYLLEAGNGSGGPFMVDGGLCESIMRVSPAPLTGTIAGSSQASIAPGVIRNMTINWAGGNSDTVPQIHAGCAPLTFDNVMIFSGGSTKKTIVSTATNSWSSGNLLGLGITFRNSNIRMNDVTGTSTLADAMSVPSGHVKDWVYFDSSYATGVTVGPSNTRLIPLNGRGW